MEDVFVDQAVSSSVALLMMTSSMHFFSHHGPTAFAGDRHPPGGLLRSFAESGHDPGYDPPIHGLHDPHTARIHALPRGHNSFTNHRIIVGHNDVARIESPGTRGNSWVTGSQMLAMVLIPTLLVRWISPRCRSIMSSQIVFP